MITGLGFGLEDTGLGLEDYTGLGLEHAVLEPIPDLNSDHFFKLSSNQTRGHGFKLYMNSYSTVRSSFSAQRVIQSNPIVYFRQGP